jgi:D-alanyl-D-alanine dipeptidase
MIKNSSKKQNLKEIEITANRILKNNADTLIRVRLLRDVMNKSHDDSGLSLHSIMVLTDSINASSGYLYYFERAGAEPDWKMMGNIIPVVLGRSGLGWGIGPHDSTNIHKYPIKQEGDGRIPAGIFKLSFVFGYKTEEQMLDLKMPYLYITEVIECVDDANSEYYNQIVSTEKIKPAKVDWQSSEKMHYYDTYYELGVFVEHNSAPVKLNHGSCIFLHNWANPNETMLGCTAMDPTNMAKIVYWLNIEKQPVLVQLTKESYMILLKKWELPEIINII